MAYTLTYSGGSITVNDGTLNSTTSLSLPGKNYAGYGQSIDQNMLSMLENFASNGSGPSNPIKGQLWYDSANAKLKYNTSSTSTPTWVILADSTGAGNISVDSITTANITTGANTTPGSITGTWTLTAGSSLQATYADLAERFEADTVYEPGTVVEFGGEKEITAVQADLSDSVFGVVSDTAAYLMNARAGGDATHPPIAMSGRVKVKVVGKVKKHDRLVSAGKGAARAASPKEATPFNTIGRSLEHKNTDGEGLVLAAVSAKF
jgi:hypothetical protein